MIHLEKNEEIAVKLDRLIAEKNKSDTELIKKISKLIDDKFNINLMKSTNKKTQKLFDDFEFQTQKLVVNGQISERNETKKDIQEILSHTKLALLSKEDLETVEILREIMKQGGLYDQITQALQSEKGNTYMSMMSNVFVDRVVYKLKSKLTLIN